MGTVTCYESVDGQVVLVTGATRGIGKQIAAQLTEFGTTVYAGARDTVDITADNQHPIASSARCTDISRR